MDDNSHTTVALQDMQIYMKPMCKWREWGEVGCLLQILDVSNRYSK